MEIEKIASSIGTSRATHGTTNSIDELALKEMKEKIERRAQKESEEAQKKAVRDQELRMVLAKTQGQHDRILE